MSMYWWTTQDHDNWFARNLIAGYSPLSGAASTEGAATEFDNLMAMPTWPTMDDFMEWANAANSPFGRNETTKVDAAQRALNSAISRVSERVQIRVHPYDTDGVTPDRTQYCEVPHEVHLATIMLAYKWYLRTQSPNGIIGSDAVGGAIRAGAWDHDVEAMLDNHTVPAIG